MGVFRGRWQSAIVCLLLVATVVTAVGSAVLAFGSARNTVTREIGRGETAIAMERATAISRRLDGAVQMARLAASHPLVAEAVRRKARDDLLAVVGPIASSAGVLAVVVADGLGVPLASSPPAGRFQPAEAGVVVEGSGSASTVRITEPVRSGPGGVRAWVQLTMRGPMVARAATAPLPLDTGVVSVVGRDGSVVRTTRPGISSRVRTPFLRAAVAEGKPAFISYHSVVLEVDRIAAIYPVAGTPWIVLVGADASVAYEPAKALGLRLLGIFFATSVIVGGLLGAVAVLSRFRRRRLEAEYTAAVVQSQVDPLTGAGNRRQLSRSLEAARTACDIAAVIAIDIDDFKVINDRYGHHAGDLALRSATTAMRGVTRTVDTVIRLGGDEFVVILPDTAEEAAAASADRIRHALESVEIEEGITLAASVGYAAGRLGDPNEILNLADQRLYEDKQRRKQAARV